MQFMVLVVLVVVVVLGAMIGLYVAGEALSRMYNRSRHGVRWSKVVLAAENGQGCLVVDYALARSRGLGDVVVWWCPSGLDEEGSIGAILREGRITDCPAEQKDPEVLQKLFPSMQVTVNKAVRLG